jgi:hypothetical protein
MAQLCRCGAMPGHLTRRCSKSAKSYRRSQFEDVRKYYDTDGTASHTSNIKGLRVAGDGTA